MKEGTYWGMDSLIFTFSFTKVCILKRERPRLFLIVVPKQVYQGNKTIRHDTILYNKCNVKCIILAHLIEPSVEQLFDYSSQNPKKINK